MHCKFVVYDKYVSVKKEIGSSDDWWKKNYRHPKSYRNVIYRHTQSSFLYPSYTRLIQPCPPYPSRICFTYPSPPYPSLTRITQPSFPYPSLVCLTQPPPPYQPFTRMIILGQNGGEAVFLPFQHYQTSATEYESQFIKLYSSSVPFPRL